MTSKTPQPMPEGMNRGNRPKAPPAPHRPNNLTVEQAFQMVLERYEDALKELADK